VTDILVFNDAYKAGNIVIPPPFAGLRDWPLLGKRLHEIWAGVQQDLPATLGSFTPQLLELRGVFVGFIRDIGSVLVKLLFSLLVMAIFLYKEQDVVRTVTGLCTRVAGASGEHLMRLARDTTRSVIKGVLGVAAVQAAMGGIGCVVVGVPGASIWTILLLVLAVAQLPVVILLGPITAYVYYHNSFLVTALFGVWVIAVSLVDNVLKPILLGQGVAAPMLVVFLGAIGGMLSSGVLGLFVGPVVLVVTYTLVRTWANLAPAHHQVTAPIHGQDQPLRVEDQQLRVEDQQLRVEDQPQRVEDQQLRAEDQLLRGQE
jgi:predicted PurR-regulated permease PerM